MKKLENKKNNSQYYGGIPISNLSYLSENELLSIFYLRCFSESKSSKKNLENELCSYLGKKKGLEILFYLESLYEILLKKGRKKFILHSVNCNCVGLDENSFIHLISFSAFKDKNEAMLIATIMTNSNIAPQLVLIAQEYAKGIDELLNIFLKEYEFTGKEKNKYN